MSFLNVLLNDIKNLANSINQKLYLLGIEIENNFLQIKECQSINETEPYFNCLQKIQHVLAELIFKEDVKVPDYLWIFVKEFDRLDDQDLRKYMYDAIREGRYFFKRISN